jgi:hypothetical protein
MERKVKVISNELSNRRIKLEDKLEKIINSDVLIEDTEEEIIDILMDMAEVENAIEIWNNLVVGITNNEKEE